VPTHWQDERQTAVLFALNGVAFLGVSVAALRRVPGWRTVALALLAATVIAYVWYIATGREDADLVGLLLKGVEIAALASLLLGAAASKVGRHLARPLAASLALLATVVLGGAVLQAARHNAPANAVSAAAQDAATATPMAGMVASDGMPALPPAVQAMAQQLSGCFAGQLPMPMRGDADMLMAPVPDRAATPAEQSAANDFARQVAQGIAPYADLNAARAAGYAPFGPQTPGMTTHWINLRFMADGDPLDPSRPGALMVENGDGGPTLVGAMFTMPGAQCPVDVAGPITDWHAHTNLCYSKPQGGWLLSSETVERPSCPSGTYNHVSPWMLHVWTVPVPGGPFAQAEQAIPALRQDDGH
jgi:hypothetical protein